ncbi:MAG: anhydro-N-acetylmuramic acid kinase [Flavobacteriaceae bacterium]|jgi:anhydro-N-acetylmuramic acid kinase
MNSYRIIGVMSGTSMDGVDIAYVSFNQEANGSWNHEVHTTHTVSFPNNLLEQLRISRSISSEELLLLDKDLGQFFGEIINDFILKNKLSKHDIRAIASHGHTVFHQPEKGFTLQIGCGATISSVTGLDVINDFRTKDIIAGGQGAPLVPIGDSLLFSKHADTFLNIGGFSNVCLLSDPIVAFDISPGNLPLNELTIRYFGQSFDDNGDLARSGALIVDLLASLDAIEYYALSPPKSLGTEWLDTCFSVVIDKFRDHSPKDLLHTVTKHIGIQIGATLESKHAKRVLVTGGGAKNKFLLETIAANFSGEIRVPDEQLIDYKEAITFGFLGALFLNNSYNTIPSVTGASKAVIGGVINTAD